MRQVKELLVKADTEDTVVTKAFTGRTLRALKNKYQAYFDQHPEDNKGPGLQTAKSTQDGCWDAYFNKPVNIDNAACPCGQNVGCMGSLVAAGNVVEEMDSTAAAILAGKAPHFRVRPRL